MRAAHAEPFAGFRIQAQKAANAVFVRQNPEGERVVEHGDSARKRAFFQRFGHEAARERPGGRGAGAHVVVGAVAGVFAVFVAGERHAQLYELEKALRRACRLAQRDIAVYIVPFERLRHRADAVAVVSGQREAIVGLLVAAGVARGAAVEAVGDEQTVLAERGEPVGGVEPGAAGTDHRRTGCNLFHFTASAARSRRLRRAPARRNSPAARSSRPAPCAPRPRACQTAGRAAARPRSSVRIFHGRRSSCPCR